MTSATFTAIRESARPRQPLPSMDRQRRHIYRLNSAFYEYNEKFVKNQMIMFDLLNYSLNHRLIWYCDLSDGPNTFKIMITDYNIYIFQQKTIKSNIKNSNLEKFKKTENLEIRFIIELKELTLCDVYYGNILIKLLYL